jgi:hypothetical protein
MHPIILVCDSSLLDSTGLIEKLKSVGIEARIGTVEEVASGKISGNVLILSEEKAESKGIARLVMSDTSRRRRVNVGMIGHHEHSALLSMSRRILAGQISIGDNPSPPPELKLEELAKQCKSKDLLAVLDKPKVVWPKAKHSKPAAQWKHRPAARDKRFLK